MLLLLLLMTDGRVDVLSAAEKLELGMASSSMIDDREPAVPSVWRGSLTTTATAAATIVVSE